MTDDTFESRLSWEKQVEFCLYKLSENGAYPISLGCVSQYQSPAEVPLEQRDKLLGQLRAERRALERMGPEAYFRSVKLVAKISVYDKALDKLTDRMLEENTDDARITWADFRQMVAQAVDELAKEGSI